MLNRLCFLIALLVFFITPNVVFAQTSWDNLSIEQKAEMIKKLTPEEQQKLQKALNQAPEEVKQKITDPSKPKSAGLKISQQDMDKIKTSSDFDHLSPEAIETLKKSPEFKNLKPEDVVKGRQMMEKKPLTAIDIKTDQKESDDKQKPSKKSKILDGKKEIAEIESVTLFKRTRQIGKYQDISLDLKPFGYEFFKDASVRVVTDRQEVPVPSNYIVGPGDEIKIMLWGRVNAQHNLTVDRNGSISMPQIGPLYVAGMTFEQMSSYLIKQSNEIVGGNIDITMGKLKTIPIFVLGDVQRPGAYTVGSFATMTDALLLAGGPSEIGSMRNIQLKRKDKVITNLDLYQVFLKGDKSSDKVLMAGDVVFVSVAGPLVGIAGNVKRPAIYELKSSFDLNYLIELSGGIVPAAYTQQIQIERIVGNEKQIVVDIDGKDLSHSKSVKLRDSDLVKIFSIVDADANVVHLKGHVKRPGKYEMKPGMKLKDVVKNVDELLPEAYFKYALIKRSYPPSKEPELIPFHLGNLLDGGKSGADIELKPKDEIYIFSAMFFKDKPSFTIQGEIRKPDKYDLIANSRVKDALLAAGGVTKEAYLEKAQILRVGKNGHFEPILYFNVTGALNDKPEDNILLREDDLITIRSLPEIFYKQAVSIGGAVFKPGKYDLAKGMTVRDLVFMAGNVLESAYLESVEIMSLVIEGGSIANRTTKNINLKKALEGHSEHNLRLYPHDSVYIRKITDWGIERQVSIDGQVRFAGDYKLARGERLSSLIERAGGYLNSAYLRGAVFTRKRVKEDQQKSMEEIADRMEKKLLVEDTGKVAASLSVEEVQARQNEIAQKKKLIENLRKATAMGRMSIRLADVETLKRSEYDILLEDGDKLIIPERSDFVSVMGSVMAQGTYIYSGEKDYEDYIDMSGGYDEYADVGKIYILKVDGSARKAKQSLFDWRRSKNDYGASLNESLLSGNELGDIEPGDVIIVPEKTEHVAWLREIRDITQILMNTAVAAGVVIKLF